MRYEVGLRFVVDKTLPPPSTVLHDALEHVCGLTVEADTNELAEHYVNLIRLALIREADKGAPCR
jgi:hypothetical protein